MNKLWTEAEIKTLEKLTKEGLNARIIGERLGRPRNAILGKQFRMRLKNVTTPK